DRAAARARAEGGGGGVSALRHHGRGGLAAARMVEEPDAARVRGAAAGGGRLMAGRLTRFIKLERPRRPDEAPHHEVAPTAPFTGPPSGMALEMDHGEQPFLRCPRCEADNTRYADRCVNCQAPLVGDDVRAWNERLWAERQAPGARGRAARQDRRYAQEVRQHNRMLGEEADEAR